MCVSEGKVNGGGSGWCLLKGSTSVCSRWQASECEYDLWWKKVGEKRKRQRLLRSTFTFRHSGLLLFCITLKWAVSGSIISSKTQGRTCFFISSGINPVYL